MKHLKRIVSALVTAGIAVAAIMYLPEKWFTPVFAALAVLCALEFSALLRRKLAPFSFNGLVFKLLGFAIIAFAFYTLATIAMVPDEHNLMLLYVIACVKLSDMGGFALGVAFGRHKMCPSISPNKSWEGMAGSIVASSLVSCAFMGITHFSVVQAVVIGVVAACVGTFGDLVESKFKRWVGVKDSGTFMPAGLGGLLDMFDSLLFAPAVLMVLFELFR